MICLNNKTACVGILVTILIICLLHIQQQINYKTDIRFFAPAYSANQYEPDCHLVQFAVGKPKERRCYPLLVNYADGCCRVAQANNCRTGLENGMRQCISYNKTIFNDDIGFLRRNAHILNRSRGGGYWLWKPYVIFRELYLARDGDIILYSDSAVSIVKNIENLTKLTTLQDIVIFPLPYLVRRPLTGYIVTILIHSCTNLFLFSKQHSFHTQIKKRRESTQGRERDKII